MTTKNIAVIRAVGFVSSETIYSVPITDTRASYNCTSKENAQGTLYEHVLSFKLAGLNPENKTTVDRLKRATDIHVDDVNDMRSIIKRGDLRFNFTIKQENGGGFGNFRGYDITIKISNLSPANTVLSE